MKMKKILVVSSFLLIMLFTVTGCTTYKAYTFKVETGDNIKLELKTNDGYNISSTLPIEIKKGDEVLSQGTFISIDDYNGYIDLVNSDDSVEVYDSATKDGIEYTFYTYDNTEFNYVIRIVGSNTGFLLGNDVSKESAEECFNRLTITKE